MNKKFRAFYRPDFDTADGPLKFEQIEFDDELWFQYNGTEDNLRYYFYIPFIDPNWIVQQWTNLIDMNGVEIYEGDIVAVGREDHLFEVKLGKTNRNVVSHENEDRVWRVEFNGFYFEKLESKLPYFSIVDNEFGFHDLTITKVVGNIFENEKRRTRKVK